MKNNKLFIVILVMILSLISAQVSFAAGGECEYPLGDINQDKVVDLSDLSVLCSQWLQSTGTADLDVSGNINFIDYALMMENWGATGNCSPVVDAGVDQAITLPNSATLDGTVTDDGLPNPPAAVTTLWTIVSGPNNVTFGDATAADTTAAFEGPGEYVLRLTADDGQDTTFDDVIITVNPSSGQENQAPVVDAGIDQSITYPTLSVNLDGAVTDDGLPNPPGAVTTLWTQESGTGTVVFGDANAIDTTATFPAAGGTFVLRLDANDGEFNTYDEVTITVIGAPQWSDLTGNYYVDGRTGNDLNAGTSGAPFATITKGLNMAGGGKILVWGGCTYTGGLSFGSNNTTLKRDPACSSQAIINGNGSDVINSSKGGCTVDGFTLTGGVNGVNLLNGQATGWTIKNCRVTGNTSTGIRFYKCANNTVNNCAIYANSSGGSYGGVTAEQTGSTGHTITQSTFYGGYYGIYALSGSATITTVRDCIVTGTSSNALRANSATITSPTYCDVQGTLSNVTLGSNCKTGSPGFVDPANGDFTPTSATYAKPASDGGWMGYRTSTQAL